MGESCYLGSIINIKGHSAPEIRRQLAMARGEVMVTLGDYY